MIDEHQRDTEEKDKKVKEYYDNHEQFLHQTDMVELKDLSKEVKCEYFDFTIQKNENKQSVNRVLPKQYRNPKAE